MDEFMSYEYVEMAKIGFNAFIAWIDIVQAFLLVMVIVTLRSIGRKMPDRPKKIGKRNPTIEKIKRKFKR